ncbi:MAG: UDP-N-acetylmuramoyl-L-alanine--D-glutamate ligase [Lachnospiraceae bacterium]|jgi:UDP-N-acetylmuramoylalanine--D-glutamate ligase|nr:UDP-N-acetylmuramoyl-L-alanine--D-glutamate ligase [Lachnospiraceae bacterium]
MVFGAGISGIAAAGLLMRHGGRVLLYDANPSGELTAGVVRNKLNCHGECEILLGKFSDCFSEDTLLEIAEVVLSPGVPLDLPDVIKIKDAGIPIIGEIELAYRFEKGRVFAITGTNGKTTTTALLGEIMRGAFKDVFVVGNIGLAYTIIADNTSDDSVTVAELSSFQLETTDMFHPAVSAILNLSPDHLDRHHTMEAYISAKKRIALMQNNNETIVLNYEDELIRELAKDLIPKIIWFSSLRVLKKGLFLRNDEIIWRPNDEGEEYVICTTDELQILGTHNHENVMAAAGMALSGGVPLEIVRKQILGFKGVEHRIEFVTEKNGVAWYNDSKGTNPDAAIKGISAMNRPTVLIGGGYDKDSEYTDWIKSFNGKVKKLILIGQTKEKIARDARNVGFTDYVFADGFDEAVFLAAKTAKEGEAVLLSPACASWDMFRSFEIRGNRFKELISEM